MKITRPNEMIARYPISSFFALTFLMVWLGMAANVSGMFPAFGEWPVSLNGRLVAVFRTRLTLINWFPNIAAVIVLSATGGWGAVRQVFARFLKWRVGINIWVQAAVLPFAAALIGIGLYAAAGGTINADNIRWVPAVLFLRFLFALTAEGIGGEAGWRGFAQDYLQKKYSPLRAAMIVGTFWALSHLPIMTIRGLSAVELCSLIIMVLCLSVILAWVYNTSGGSLLIVAFVHCLFDATDAAVSRSFIAVLSRSEFMPVSACALFLIASMIVVGTHARLGLQKPLFPD